MKLCMYVGYHDANNVSNFGDDPVTQLHFKNAFVYEIGLIAIREVSPPFDEEQQYERPYQPKHSPSYSAKRAYILFVSIYHRFLVRFSCIIRLRNITPTRSGNHYGSMHI